jgi:hypothetical protein
VARAEDEGVTVHNGPSHQQQGAAIMIGRRFGRWHVLRRAGSGRGREARWECVCDCGTERDVSAASLIHGRTKSCGCLHSEQLSKRMREIHRRARQAARGHSPVSASRSTPIPRVSNRAKIEKQHDRSLSDRRLVIPGQFSHQLAQPCIFELEFSNFVALAARPIGNFALQFPLRRQIICLR